MDRILKNIAKSSKSRKVIFFQNTTFNFIKYFSFGFLSILLLEFLYLFTKKRTFLNSLYDFILYSDLSSLSPLANWASAQTYLYFKFLVLLLLILGIIKSLRKLHLIASFLIGVSVFYFVTKIPTTINNSIVIEVIKEVSLLSFSVLIIEITLPVVNWLRNWDVSSSEPEVKQINLFKVFGQYIKQIRDKYNNFLDNSSSSDEPLRSLGEIQNIQGFMNNGDIFSSFVSNTVALSKAVKDSSSYGKSAKAICIDGSWGSGKTSLINIVKEELLTDSKKSVIWIDFNPWSFNNDNELIEDFFNTLNKKLKEEYEIDLGQNLKQYVELITPITEATGFSGFIKSFIGLDIFRKQTLNNLKTKLSKKLSSIGEKIVICLDDIDRLKYDEVLVVLQLVRQLSNFPNIIFILPFDFTRTDSLIAETKGGLHKDFLKKIISSRFKLDPNSYEELEAIFIHTILYDKNSERINPSIINKFKIAFERFCFKNTEAIFRDILKQEDGSNAKDETLKPMFDFTFPFFDSVFGTKSYVTNFIQSRDRLRQIINNHLARGYQDFGQIACDLLAEFSIFDREQLSLRIEEIFNTRIINNIVERKSETEEIKNRVKDAINNNTKQSIYATAKTLLDNFKNDSNLFLGISNNNEAVNAWGDLHTVLDEFNKKFFEINSEYVSKIKQVFMAKITPRQVKSISRDIEMKSTNEEILDLSADDLTKLVDNIAILY